METLARAKIRLCLATLLCALASLSVMRPAAPAAAAASPADIWATPYYATGTPHLRTLYVDYRHGDDAHDGASPRSALRTLDAAWRSIPEHTPLAEGYRILLAPGDYPESALPVYWESRYGTYQAPIVIQPAAAAHSVRLHGYLNIYDTRYLYLIGLDIVTDRNYGGGGNVIHFEKADHVLIRNCRLDGFDGKTSQPQETLKVNQSRYLFVEDSDIGGAFWFGIDTMAVEYGHITHSKVHRAGDDCLLLKGGSASFLVDGNEVYDCGVVGLAAGEGSGIEFLVAPWLHYDSYNTVFVNNIVHDTQNAGLAARGAFNAAFVGNTLYRIGTNRSIGGPLLLFALGMRGCDGHLADCRRNYALGAWGSEAAGDEQEIIPNRNVYVYDNLIFNPPPVQTQYSHLTVFGPRPAPRGLHLPATLRSDDNLQLRGNVVWNGPASLELGPEESDQGCQASNPTCNLTQLRADNLWNQAEPRLANLSGGDLHVIAGSLPISATAVTVPEFPATDPAGAGLPADGAISPNVEPLDLAGQPRVPGAAPGAYATPRR